MQRDTPPPPDPAWRRLWTEHVADVRGDVAPPVSAARMRELVKSRLLSYADVERDPAKFFAAHRLFVDPTKRGPGSWIRLTVHYNLFSGTVLGLGGPEHVKVLDEMEARGELGCFALTERFAGVNSGLVVNTTAEWVPSKQRFVLHSPDEGSYKNWISQGLVAERAAVIADLRVGGKSYGPHGFLMQLRDGEGRVTPGVTLGDMGLKTTANDLDNAWIKFDRVELPKSALLNRFADVERDAYVQKTKERMRIEIIGQRLLTGRVAVAQAALAFARRLFDKTREYAEKKQCWSPGGRVPLASVPHIASVFREADLKFARADLYMARVEHALSKSLRRAEIPDASVVEAIAVGKVACVEVAIDLVSKLKQEVGAYALMGGTGFENDEFLLCTKFAEGDSRILMQKLARDRFRAFQADKARSSAGAGGDEERLCAKLLDAGKDGWDREYETVYALANAVAERTMEAWTGLKAPRREDWAGVARM